MHNALIYPAGTSPAIHYAAKFLYSNSIPITSVSSRQITHLLLDVPSINSSAEIHNADTLNMLLDSLPKDITIIGGFLNHPEFSDYRTYDLLKTESYLYGNAVITAHCALRIAIDALSCTLPDSPALIIGWGRIGKCLAHLLRQNGADVWLVIRNSKERAMAQAFGYRTLLPTQDVPDPQNIKLLFNTVPTAVISEERLTIYSQSIKIDLASLPGLYGNDVIVARGLPGKYAPESSGKLIGQSILNYLMEE